MSAFFTPGTTLSVRARRALFESGNAATTRRQSGQTEESTPDENIESPPVFHCPSTVRRPLSFFSPNNIKTNLLGGTKKVDYYIDSTKRNDYLDRNSENIANLKLEITELQSHVQILDEVAEGSRVSETPKADDSPTSKKDQTLCKLNRKLTEIQRGLLEIENERERLFSKVKFLEREKKSIQFDLSQREKEISTLSKRCSMQTDKSKQFTRLQAENNKFSLQIQELQDELKGRDIDKPGKELLNNRYQLALRDRDELKRQLSDITKDHESLSEKLYSCIDTCEKLTEEKRQWSYERSRLIEQTTKELESQRLKHEQSVESYEAEIKDTKQKVNHLDGLLNNKLATIKKLEEKIEQNNENSKLAIQNLTYSYEQQLRESFDVNQTTIGTIKIKYEDEIKHVESKIAEKDNVIKKLRSEVEACMQDLMSASSALNEHKENSVLVESMSEDIEKLEHDRYLLKETIHERETEIAELSAEILKSEIEKEFLQQDSQKLLSIRIKLEEAVQEKDFLRRECETALKAARNQAMELEKELTAMKTRNDLLTNEIRAEHAEQVLKIQKQLHVLHTEKESKDAQSTLLLLDKDRVICTLESQNETLKIENQSLLKRFEAEVNDTRETSERLDLLVQKITNENNERIKSINSKYEDILLGLRRTITKLEEERSQQKDCHKKEIEAKDSTIGSLRNQLLNISDDLMQRSEMNKTETGNLQRDINKLKASLAIKEDEIRELRVIEIQERDEAIDSLNANIRKLKIQHSEKEQKSLEIIASLENHLSFGSSRYSNLEREKADCDKEKLALKEKLQCSIDDLQREIDFGRITIMTLERKLMESNNTSLHLQEQMKGLTENQAVSQSELNSLRAKNGAVTLENERLRISLADEIDRHQFGDVAHLQTKYELLESELNKAEKTVVDQQDQLAELEAIVQDRTQSLTSTMDAYKESESKLDSSERRYNTLEQKASYLQVDLMDCESLLSRLRSEMRKKESDFLEDLHEEQNRREISESQLEAALVKLDQLQCEKREFHELKRENTELKDKIQRQEAFLQKKISKEKVLRDRNITNNCTKSMTPHRIVHIDRLGSTCTSKLKNPLIRGSTRIPNVVHASDVTLATCSTADDIETLDLELENLLAD